MDIVIFVGICVFLFVLIKIVVDYFRSNNARPMDDKGLKYQYTKKQFVMTKTENDFYQVLQQALETNYMIFPQAHLDMFLDHKVKGQSWKAALSTIQRKSVDFLICNHTYYNPLVAIELDDSSHMREDRAERDSKVDQICQDAGMPIVHVKWRQNYDASDVMNVLAPYLK